MTFAKVGEREVRREIIDHQIRLGRGKFWLRFSSVVFIFCAFGIFAGVVAFDQLNHAAHLAIFTFSILGLIVSGVGIGITVSEVYDRRDKIRKLNYELDDINEVAVKSWKAS